MFSATSLLREIIAFLCRYAISDFVVDKKRSSRIPNTVTEGLLYNAVKVCLFFCLILRAATRKQNLRRREIKYAG